jgi:hypothetical protein
MNRCIICGGNIKLRCRCPLSDVECESGHQYHRDPLTKEYHEGRSDHSRDWRKDGCCESKKIISTKA